MCLFLCPSKCLCVLSGPTVTFSSVTSLIFFESFVFALSFYICTSVCLSVFLWPTVQSALLDWSLASFSLLPMSSDAGQPEAIPQYYSSSWSVVAGTAIAEIYFIFLPHTYWSEDLSSDFCFFLARLSMRCSVRPMFEENVFKSSVILGSIRFKGTPFLAVVESGALLSSDFEGAL